LTQILINLIGNAVKFTSKGSVSLTFNNKGIEDGTLYLGLEVRDTGIGIEKEKLNLIFGRFQQADEDVTRKYGGTGLGLSIVKELVELQHGQIRAKSERGEGTTFYLTIPYKICREPYISHRSSFMQQSTEPVPLQQDQNVRILIVEDNDVNQTLLRHIFRNWQINFEIAGNGIEALDKLKNGTYDLVLMDIQMPELDGYTTTQQIRNHLKLNIPIIAMTAHAMAGEREKCLSYGMNEYISKPLREEELRKLILQFVSLNTRLPLKSEKESVPLPPTYQYINLTYMKEVSSGNIEYEKEVTIQFIGSVPQQLKALDEAAQSSDSDRLKKIAHNLKTTVSVMGLNEVLERYLSEIEDGEAKENLLKENIENIKQICFNALPEATHFLASLS
jgi:CheY-like chemotaxis protein